MCIHQSSSHNDLTYTESGTIDGLDKSYLTPPSLDSVHRLHNQKCSKENIISNIMYKFDFLGSYIGKINSNKEPNTNVNIKLKVLY